MCVLINKHLTRSENRFNILSRLSRGGMVESTNYESCKRAYTRNPGGIQVCYL